MNILKMVKNEKGQLVSPQVHWKAWKIIYQEGVPVHGKAPLYAFHEAYLSDAIHYYRHYMTIQNTAFQHGIYLLYLAEAPNILEENPRCLTIPDMPRYADMFWQGTIPQDYAYPRTPDGSILVPNITLIRPLTLWELEEQQIRS